MKKYIAFILILFSTLCQSQTVDTFDIKGKVIDWENVDLGRNWGWKWLEAFSGSGMTVDTVEWGWGGKNNAFIVDATGRNTSQALRIYNFDGCEESSGTSPACDTSAMDIYIETATGWVDMFMSYDFKVSPGFQGGESGGKFNGLHSWVASDYGEHDVYLMFRPADSMLWWYIYDRETVGYGESVSTDFKFLTNKWYNISIRVYFDDDGLDHSGFTELFIDGKHISTATGWDFTGSGEPRGAQRFDIAFFFGGGGASTADVWLEYDDVTIWRPTSAAIAGGLFAAEGITTTSGKIIPTPNAKYYNKWYHRTGDYYFKAIDSVYYYNRNIPRDSEGNAIVPIKNNNWGYFNN